MATCQYENGPARCLEPATHDLGQAGKFCEYHAEVVITHQSKTAGGGPSRPAAAGASTPAKAATATTPETDGGNQTAAKGAAGARTSRPSPTKPLTTAGKRPTPLSAPLVTPGPKALEACQLLSQRVRPAEIVIGRGVLRATTAQHDVTLDAREWVLVGYPLADDVPADGAMIVYRLPAIPEIVEPGGQDASQVR